ncbi:MAG: cytochrome c peroxidase [Saprospiraceae bacterium]
MKKILLFLFIAGFVSSCDHPPIIINEELDNNLTDLIEAHSPTGIKEFFVMPESFDMHHLPNQDQKNPINEAKVELGKLLFFETGLALEAKYPASLQAYSCSSCHIPSLGFTAGRFQGIADGAVGYGQHGEGRRKNDIYKGSEVDAQGARPLPTINLAYVTNALWAGSFGSKGVNIGTESVWNQDTLVAINAKQFEGLEANNQRALIVHRQVIDNTVTDRLGYTGLFDAAFPEYAVSKRYSRETGGLAIAAYFRTIFTNQAPFQNWLKGNGDALSDNQKKGAILFFGKAGCVNCHKSPSFNSMEFQAVGVKNLYQSGYEVFRTDENDLRNFGRGGFTKRAEDMHKFKVPQLYNLKDVGFYFHGASKSSIREVVEYFNNAVPENPIVPKSQISEFFKPLNLANQEMDQLADFISNGLFDPNLQRYAPIRTMSGFCFPNNDPQSKIDQGCN